MGLLSAGMSQEIKIQLRPNAFALVCFEINLQIVSSFVKTLEGKLFIEKGY
jgi:hypothetical protein